MKSLIHLGQLYHIVSFAHYLETPNAMQTSDGDAQDKNK